MLDVAKVLEKTSPLLGVQWCGEGRIKDICPLYRDNVWSPRMEIMCSLEHYNEITGSLMTWVYHSPREAAKLLDRIGGSGSYSHSLTPSNSFNSPTAIQQNSLAKNMEDCAGPTRDQADQPATLTDQPATLTLSLIHI